jgi:hypothetical protein
MKATAIKGGLLLARMDAIKRPVFDEPEEDKWPGKLPAHEDEEPAPHTSQARSSKYGR